MTLDTDTHLELRHATTEADLDTLRDLILAVGLSSERGAITATLDGSTYWIAELDGLPAGCIGLEHGKAASLIRSASVLPHARHRGLGRALATSALTQATLRGDRAVYLFSTDAGPFWERFGFTRVSPGAVAAALPGTPQVRSGEDRGWLRHEVGWMRSLGGHSPETGLSSP